MIFKSKLEPVLRIRKNTEKQRAMELGVAISAEQALEIQHQNAVVRSIEAESKKLEVPQGTPAGTWLVLNEIVARHIDAIEEAEEEIEVAADNTEEKREQFIEAKGDCSVVERRLQRQRADYQLEVAREQQKEEDERAINFWRGAKAS